MHDGWDASSHAKPEGTQGASWGRWAGALALAAAMTGASTAQADGFALNRYHPAPLPDDTWAVSRPDDAGHNEWAPLAILDYSLDPLVIEGSPGNRDSEQVPIVHNQLMLHVGVAVGLWERVVLFGQLPLQLLMNGDDGAPFGVASADGAGVGDLALGGRVRLYGEREDPFSLGLEARVSFPTSDRIDASQAYSGDETVSGRPMLLMEGRKGPVRITFNVGARLVRTADVTTGVEQGNALLLGAALTYNPVEELALMLEAFGSSEFSDMFGREATPFQALLGAKYHHETGVNVGVGAGPGISRGLGAPDLRVLLQIGFLRRVHPEPEPVVTDIDGDGIEDTADVCPSEPEDFDAFEDQDGCPDPDNDDDGVLDVADECPGDQEDQDGFEDDDGCPDPDNDGDGLSDAQDQCPLEAEDRDAFEDADGCPDIDNDKDGVLDAQDECPFEPGKPEAGGCPKSVRVDAESGTIQILERVEFATGKAKILPRSEELLGEVVAVILANPQLGRIRVEGHTDDRGRDAYNKELSKQRALAVKRWLIERGVDPARLGASGCGEGHPIDDNATPSGRQSNRRVEFHIVGTDGWGFDEQAGCTQSQ